MLSLLAPLLAFALGSAQAAPRALVLVADRSDPIAEPVIARLVRAAPGGAAPAVVRFDQEQLSDPIQRGELLARLGRHDLLVPIGDSAASLLREELEEVPVYFVGAGVVPGKRLAAEAEGVLAYGVDDLLDAAASLGQTRLGIALTPGYEALAAQLKARAAARGLSVEQRLVSAPRDIPAALGELFERCRAIWLFGDPLLARGAGFSFAAERSLSRRVPLLAADAWEARRGALLTFEPAAEPLATLAAADLAELAAGRAPVGARVKQAPRGGRILVNAALQRQWGLKPASGVSWKPLR